MSFTPNSTIAEFTADQAQFENLLLAKMTELERMQRMNLENENDNRQRYFSPDSTITEFTADQASYQKENLTPSEELRRMRITEMERMQKISSHGGYDNGHKMGMAKPETLADRMKLLLSTAKGADAHFLVGQIDKKELVHAHKTILIASSNVFEALFQTEEENSNGTKTGNGNLVVEVRDVEPEAFKVMLSFIYTDDLNELNGDNAMAVLYAAKKYNIPSFVRPSLQIPISELRNVFLAYAQALLFELEDFSRKCLLYICQNATQLFRSKDFLQIDQKILCNLLESDRFLLRDEFEIWKIALRWADEKCRQNGIECSSGNRRSFLGPALFKIRFPNIQEEDFATVVPSGVLTMEELLGIYQFNSHPFLYLRGVPGLYSLKFPCHGRIFAKGHQRGTLVLKIEKMSEFAGESVESRRFGDAMEIKGLALKIRAIIRQNNEGTDEKKYLGFHLWCDAKQEGPRNCIFSATFRIISEKSEAENSIGKLYDNVIDPVYQYGFGNFITFSELMDPSNGFYLREEDKVILAIDLTAKDEKTEQLISDPTKFNGTISMEIEKMSEFAREVIWSERKSEAVYIKGLPWKIWAGIEKKKGNTDKNDKWLAIYLLCDAPEKDENWSCKCSKVIRIVSQKSGAANYKRGEYTKEYTFNSKMNSWGYANVISFAELMNPRKGFYNQNEDKVTLAIDVTVKEAKAEDKS
ncbi:hypothetical protein niasHT_003456 [Heterodera trifolii]|uniref:BTB domain-containing protein n=1 Tax=Heterodera trifolii TaxID=157864 RepID=A0ABD2M2J0_9BILA